MSENRNIKLLISLIVLSAATALLFFFTGGNRSSFDKNIFKVLDYSTIDEVVFESAEGKVELKFNGTNWKVNGKYEADAQLITVFFASILQVEPKRKISGPQQDSIKSRMTEKGITVSLMQVNEMKKQFSVVGNDQKTETYFQQKNEAPYFVTIPGYRVYVASIFELTESEWRDKRVFNFNWQNFKSLKAHFAIQPKQDFTVSLAGGLFGVEEIAVADTTKLSGYLEGIFNLKADRFLSAAEVASYDSIFSNPPAFQLDIQDIAKRGYRLAIYSSPKDQVILAKINGEAIFLRPTIAARVIRTRDYFEVK